MRLEWFLAYRLVLGPPGHEWWKSLSRIVCRLFVFLCVCARVHVHTQVCRREYTYWNCKVLYSMYLSFSLLEKHLQYCDKFINWNLFSSLFISFVKETEIWGKQVKRLKPEEHILNYRISPGGFLSGTRPSNHKVLIIVTFLTDELFFCIERCFSITAKCASSGVKTSRTRILFYLFWSAWCWVNNWNSPSQLPHLKKE